MLLRRLIKTCIATLTIPLVCGCTLIGPSRPELATPGEARTGKFLSESIDNSARGAAPDSPIGEPGRNLFLDNATMQAGALTPLMPAPEPKLPADPRAAPAGPNLPKPNESTNAASPPTTLPAVDLKAEHRYQRRPETNPHLRNTPTATGALLNLSPHESPADRVVELADRVETLSAQIAVLHGRIREMEGHAASREQSIAESRREAEFLNSEVTRYRREAESLKSRLDRLEREDIELLKSIIAALEKLLGGRPE